MSSFGCFQFGLGVSLLEMGDSYRIGLLFNVSFLEVISLNNVGVQVKVWNLEFLHALVQRIEDVQLHVVETDEKWTNEV